MYAFVLCFCICSNFENHICNFGFPSSYLGAGFEKFGRGKSCDRSELTACLNNLVFPSAPTSKILSVTLDFLGLLLELVYSSLLGEIVVVALS